VFQITDTNRTVLNHNLDTIVHVASNQKQIDTIKHRIEELEFNGADMSDEFNELNELFVKCTPLRTVNKAVERIANEYRNRMVEITNMFNSRKTELADLKQQLMLEQQKAILECQANPPVLLSGEEVIANFFASELPKL
jgi:glutamine synthetase type III